MPYHYVIDGRFHQHNNPLIFDQSREQPYHEGQPGYLCAMLNGLHLVTESKGQPLTTAFIIEMHRLIVEGVTFKKFTGAGWSIHLEAFKPSLRENANTPYGFGFNIDNQTSTVDGISEINTKYARFATVEVGANNAMRLYVKLHANIQEEMELIVNRYNQSQRTNLDIATFAHEMNLLHPFTDGNIRTLTFLIINKLLIDKVKPPIIFYDPNIFDAFSCVQLGEFIDKELELSGRLCCDFSDPFNLAKFVASDVMPAELNQCCKP